MLTLPLQKATQVDIAKKSSPWSDATLEDGVWLETLNFCNHI